MKPPFALFARTKRICRPDIGHCSSPTARCILRGTYGCRASSSPPLSAGNLQGKRSISCRLHRSPRCSSPYVSVEFPWDLGVGVYSSAGLGLDSSCPGLEWVMILTMVGVSSGGLEISQKMNEISTQFGGHGFYLQVLTKPTNEPNGRQPGLETPKSKDTLKLGAIFLLRFETFAGHVTYHGRHVTSPSVSY